jgi:hypothetical protein
MRQLHPDPQRDMFKVRYVWGDQRVFVISPERRKFVQTLLDRARENTLILIDETRGIISAMETGILINWSPQEFDRLKAVLAEHERLLQMHAP